MDKNIENNCPRITVFMPVYNGEKYLFEAIESILGQTFSYFEFLIINDGSTDHTVNIINSFHDPRIRLVNHENNMGLIATLNEGIKLSRGELIARMDADDISIPVRLQKQMDFLNQNPAVAMVASHIVQINEDGEETGYWADDMQTNDFLNIYSTLAKTNCIAHPSVMIRKSIAEIYLYKTSQKGSEDWDLWMRMAADGLRIEKINEVLLKYRIHELSATSIINTAIGSQKKIIHVKRKFLQSECSHFKLNGFFFRVLYSFLRSEARYIKIHSLPEFMRFFKRIFTTNPFKVASGYISLKNYLNDPGHIHSLFFFFSYTHVGGAEKVHADIVKCLADKQPLVFFTGFSKNKAFLSLFKANATVFNIPETLNYPWFGKKSRTLIINFINHQKDPKIFGCNSIFYYQLLPLIAKNVWCADLLHDFGQLANIVLSTMHRFDKRIFIGQNAINKAQKFYFENNIGKNYSEKFLLIRNCVDIPATYPGKIRKDKLKVIYVGRGSSEKRVHIVVDIACKCHNKNIKSEFQIVGNMRDSISPGKFFFINYTGEVNDRKVLQKIYEEADILLITSEREGFPVSIMEAMANGVVPISTYVGDVPVHIKNNETGFISNAENDSAIADEMVNYIQTLTENHSLLDNISRNAYEYAKNNFGSEEFCNAYRNLLG